MPIPFPKDEELPDFFHFTVDKINVEILSCRIEYDKKLTSSKTISIPFSFYNFNDRLDEYTMDWYSTNIKSDLKDDVEKPFFMLPHRHIMTGDIDVFNFNGRTIDKIDLIFGKQLTYWRLSGESYQECGQSLLEIGNCPCCINKQIKRIIKKLREKFDNKFETC